MVADEGCMAIVFRSAGIQAGHVFDPHIVANIVWSFNQEQVDVMEAVTFLADVQRNETALIATTEYVNTDRGVLFSNLGMSLMGIGKVRPEMFRVFSWGL